MSSPRQITYEIELGVAQTVTVVRARIEERISADTFALVEVATDEDLDLEPRLAQPARLSMLVDGLEVRAWPLRIAGSRFEEAKSNGLRFTVELRSSEWFLRFTQDTRKFRKLSAKDIVTKVLAQGGVLHEWRLVRDTPRRNYCVQYRESNLDFVRRLLEFEGIYYTWSDLLSDDGGKLILSDLSQNSPPVPGVTHFELHDGASAMTDGAEAIHEFTKGARVRSGKATVNDFDWKKPSTKLLQTSAADLDQDLEIYDYPTGYRNAPDGEYLARIRMEALRVGSKFVSGKGSVSSFAPAHVFSFGPVGGPAFAGEYLLVSVAHSYQNRAFVQGEVEVYENAFEAIPKEQPFRPDVATPRPTISGHHSAMVRGPAGVEIHTERLGRFRVQFHWDREAKSTDEDSRWLRVAQEAASSMFLARVGWEMNVGYIDGDPDRPIGLSRNINGVMPPSYGQPGKKNVMTVKTPSSPHTGGFNEIRLDDSAGSMEFYVKAEKDLVNLVKNDRTELVTINDTHTVVGLLNRSVERDQTVTIGSNLTVEVDGTHTVTVGKNHEDTVGGTEKIDGGSIMTLDVKGNDTEKVASVRLSIVGSIKPPNMLARAKSIVDGLIPSPRAAVQKLVDGALAGAKQGFDAQFQEAGNWGGASGAGAPGGGGPQGGPMGPGPMQGGPQGGPMGPGPMQGGPQGPMGPNGPMGPGGPGSGPMGPGGPQGPQGPMPPGGMGAGPGAQPPGMPSIPGMPSVPGMPSLPGMPSIPGLGGAAGGLAQSALGALGGGGNIQAGLQGALQGGVQGAQNALQGMVPKLPDAKGLASQLTGGLSDGVTLDKMIALCCSGNIARNGEQMLVRMVGGAHIEAAKGGISMNAKFAMAEIIGGAKITICTKGGIYESVTGPLVTTVGAAIIRKCKEDMSYSAETTLVKVGATADLKSDKKMSIESDDTILLTGKTKLEVKVGKATITLTPGAVKLTGDLAMKAPSKIGITGKKDNVTA